MSGFSAMQGRKTNEPPTLRWMKHVLLAAGLYNIAWGAFVVIFPLTWFEWTDLEPPRYPQIWQCIGMFVGVYGVGYFIAAFDPMRHWPIVLVGFLGKLFGPLGFVYAALRGDFPWAWGLTIVTNDLIWWVPFALILHRAWRETTRLDVSEPDEPTRDDLTGPAMLTRRHRPASRPRPS